MELLQKLTLYDLLGYALPGTVLILIYGWDDMADGILCPADGTGPAFALLLIMAGYLTGIIIAQLTSLESKIGKLCKKFWEKSSALCKKKQQSQDTAQPAPKNADNIFDKYDIDNTILSNALINAHVIPDAASLNLKELANNYFAAIYADIQSDDNYSRLHNYASAELLCKNMALVSFLCIFRLIDPCAPAPMILAVISALCFYARQRLFCSRKEEYCLYWFLEKYGI
ncbi:MAG: hypothetical protein NC419_10350 [Muribaculaceae bacterium]|nr:hypothetical protein [Muribaculaceae bacterium]